MKSIHTNLIAYNACVCNAFYIVKSRHVIVIHFYVSLVAQCKNECYDLHTRSQAHEFKMFGVMALDLFLSTETKILLFIIIASMEIYKFILKKVSMERSVDSRAINT